MDQEIQKIKAAILAHIAQNPEIFEDAALAIDKIINDAMEDYDKAVIRIQQEVISDPNPIENPEQEVLDRLEQVQQNIITTIQHQIENLTRQ